MKRFLGTIMLFGMTLGWWGFVYPELCLIPEECEQQADEYGLSGGQEQMGEAADGKKQAEMHQETICIKSRLYEYICQYKEAAHEQ